MIQTGKFNWEIKAPAGHVLEQKSLGSIFQAQEYIENWVSSYNNWTYEIVPLLPEGVDKNKKKK
jgi:hypothetical protein